MTRDEVRRFRKKPVVIEAIQWDGIQCQELIDFVGDDLGELRPGRWAEIKTLEGQHIASPGDWIIRGVKGEHYPCKPDIFEATYEPADAAPSLPAGDEGREALTRAMPESLFEAAAARFERERPDATKAFYQLPDSAIRSWMRSAYVEIRANALASLSSPLPGTTR